MSSIREVRKLLPYWQEVLNLKEWRITVKYGTTEEMTDETGHTCHGLNYINVEELTANILLAKGDGEETLIHELLHIVFDGHKPQTTKYDALHERALNRTSAALYRLSRR